LRFAGGRGNVLFVRLILSLADRKAVNGYSHPNCKTLVCFVYDPEGRIGNPVGLETDLSQDDDGLKVVVIVAPK
ncbi:MAG: hypothetical protein JXL80_02325, partial [Planctomycetes bacterium]|nr:hypothetical protein [Planctomycetota bacterium]